MSEEKCPPQDPPEPSPHREILLRVFLETFDRYVRSIAEISAETGVSGLTVETLMAYCVALPEADELIYGFICGDRTLFPDQVRDVLDRDTRRLELEPTELAWGAPLAATFDKGPDHGKTPNLETFIRENRQIFRQVGDSPKSFLVRWVMLHLMERAQARERGHRVVHEFFTAHPEVFERLHALTKSPSHHRKIAAGVRP
jgi:hypothetical protein